MTAACISGLIAGTILTCLQSAKVFSLIYKAEEFENGEFIHYKSSPQEKLSSKTQEDHQVNHKGSPSAVHEHEEDAWAPKDGIQRWLFTLLANTSLATGWSFLLCSVLLFVQRINLKTGVLLGVLGYLTFFVAPSLGLSPELPGTEAASLDRRQAWWVFTVLATGGAFCLLFFSKNYFAKSFAVLLLILPHVIGAPHPEVHGGTAPDAMLKAFILATFITNGVFWLILGSTNSLIFKKFVTIQL